MTAVSINIIVEVIWTHTVRMLVRWIAMMVVVSSWTVMPATGIRSAGVRKNRAYENQHGKKEGKRFFHSNTSSRVYHARQVMATKRVMKGGSGDEAQT